jgi:hypothetical protein
MTPRAAARCRIAKNQDKFNPAPGLLPEWAGTGIGRALWMTGTALWDRMMAAFARLERILPISFGSGPASPACVGGDLVA